MADGSRRHLLLEPEATVGAVARQVGYGSPFTFSTAFKRARGVSPRAYRDRARDARDRAAPVDDANRRTVC